MRRGSHEFRLLAAVVHAVRSILPAPPELFSVFLLPLYQSHPFYYSPLSDHWLILKMPLCLVFISCYDMELSASKPQSFDRHFPICWFIASLMSPLRSSILRDTSLMVSYSPFALSIPLLRKSDHSLVLSHMRFSPQFSTLLPCLCPPADVAVPSSVFLPNPCSIPYVSFSVIL